MVSKRLWPLMLMVGVMPHGANAQAFVSGRVLEGGIVPALSVHVSIKASGSVPVMDSTDSGGRFRIGPLDPGEYLLVAERRCLNAVEVEIEIPEGSSSLDLGQILAEPLRPRPLMSHSLCPPMPDEDRRTRQLLGILESHPTWIEFGARHATDDMPSSSQWLFWGTSVDLFGRERGIISSHSVGAGLSAVAVAMGAEVEYTGPLITVTSGDLRDIAVVVASVRMDRYSPDPLPLIRATFRRQGPTWVVESVDVVSN